MRDDQDGIGWIEKALGSQLITLINSIESPWEIWILYLVEML